MFKRSTIRAPPLGRVRFAGVDDIPRIMELVNEAVAETFRIYTFSDINYLL